MELTLPHRNRPEAGGDPPPADRFEDFYRARADGVYRALALTLGHRDLAREATDEAMARALARWDRVSRLDNPAGWAYRVGLNWATSWWRKRRREQPLGGGSDRATTVDFGAVHAYNALRRLPVPQRAVIVCRVLLDLSIAQTAEVLGVAEGTVKSRLARGLAALREVLGKESGDEG